jgi:hypothetical protein
MLRKPKGATLAEIMMPAAGSGPSVMFARSLITVLLNGGVKTGAVAGAESAAAAVGLCGGTAELSTSMSHAASLGVQLFFTRRTLPLTYTFKPEQTH